MAYLKELIARLGKALGIKPTSPGVTADAPTANRVEAAQDPDEGPSTFEARPAEAAGSSVIAGE